MNYNRRIQMPFKQLRVHFGNDCNMKCSFCHSIGLDTKIDYKPDKIVSIFNEGGFTACSYVGGETTLYLDKIVDLSNRLPAGVRNSFTTNGSTMEGDILYKTLRNQFVVSVSVNEFTLGSLKYEGLKQIYQLGTSCVWDGKHTLDEIDKMYDEVSKGLGYLKFPYYNLVHRTGTSSEFHYTDSQIDRFLSDVAYRLQLACHSFVRGKISRYSMLLLTLNTWFSYKGFGCWRDDYITVQADGKYSPCSYSPISFDDFEKADTFIRGSLHNKFKCDSCIVPKNQCKMCYLSLDDTECTILRGVYQIYMRTLKKYRINYMEVYDRLQRYPFTIQGGVHCGVGDSI